MGHIRLGVLPKYPKWKTVISLLENADVPAAEVADKVLDGSKDVLGSESVQASVSYCVWLIGQITLASRTEDFTGNLAKLGIETSEHTSAAEFLSKVSRTASRQLSHIDPHTALNNIAGLALGEALTRTIGIHANTLFGAELTDVQSAFKKYSTNRQFSRLLHTYFTAYLTRTLRFVVDKEIANHVGTGRRFENINDKEAFETALEGFAGQTSRIIDKFAGGWYSKRVWQQGAISETDAAGFVHVALSKLSADLDLSGAQQ